jgi:hypothetical protein
MPARRLGETRDDRDNRVRLWGNPTAKLHAAAAIVLGLVVPAASWGQGTGWLAWTMYSGSATYRLTATAWTAAHGQNRISPTEIAAYASGNLSLFLAGAERWRRAPVGGTLAAQLPRIAKIACWAPGARRVSLTLEYRANLDSETRVATIDRPCEPRN